MPVRFLSDAELARLSSWPDEIAAEDLVTFFTLSPDDLAWLAGFNRDENRLGAAVQLCALPWLGWIPDDPTGCPASAFVGLATALTINAESAADLLAAYGGWQGRTRREHRSQVLARLGKPDDLSAFCNSRRGVFEGSVNLAGDSPVEGVCLPQPRRLSPILWTQ